VNDMAMATEALRRVLSSAPAYRLAWVACSGAEAVERCRQDTPDLILMDLVMPGMDGAEATRRIMSQTPCAILVVTASVDGHFAKVFEALGAGALDVVQTPVLSGSSPLEGATALKFKIETIRRLVFGDNGQKYPSRSAREEPQPISPSSDSLIAIGASAGGPATLAKILSGLPRDFPAAIVIIQHMDAQFAPLMADWLNEQSKLSVRIARQGDQPQANAALIAGTNDHLVVTCSQLLSYTPEPRNCCYRPSVDVFFESVVRYWKGKLVGVLLTGMGRDGARGLKAIRAAGSLTIAQDAASCVVYGMPKAAAELDAAVKILPPNEIASELMNFVTVKPITQEQRVWSGQMHR
jgi:two-component system, chemotaxis family, response regulator WspF